MADPSAFIRQILPYAVEVGDRYGIDPVTIITQAALETGWGEEVAGNNYFGIKSHGQPGGQSVTTHEEVNGKRVKVQDHFRTYGSLADSVNDYGRFLTENPRYAEAIAQEGYRGELGGIAGSGYATDSHYPQLVQNVARSVTRRMPPLPPGSLPEVGTLTDTVPSNVAPVTPSIDLQQMRRSTAPSRLVADSFASLPKRSSATLGDSLALNPVQADFPGAGQWDGGYSPALGAVTLNSNPRNVAMPRRRPETAPSDLIETSFRRVASTNPTKLPPVPPSTLGQRAGQSLIERSPLPATKVATAPSRPRVTVSTPYTTPQSGIERSVARTVEPSPIGQSPATRVVQSVPMPPISRVAAFVPEARYIEPRNAPPAATKYAGPFVPGTNIAQPNGSIIPNKSQDRLPVGVANNGIDISPGLSAVGAQAYAPTPHPPITRAPTPAPPYRAVADQLDVREMPALPRRRPDLGMGGVDISAPIAQTGQVAPVPMPRLERGGIFGKPQIFGHDVPLPGIFGVLQGATKAMNNASGPFNNGADNSLYDLLRGGDFNTPGAATVQSGGFRYAPRLGGGFINVGRADPRISGAQTYANRTTNWGQNDDAADRVNGRGGSSGARSISG